MYIHSTNGNVMSKLAINNKITNNLIVKMYMIYNNCDQGLCITVEHVYSRNRSSPIHHCSKTMYYGDSRSLMRLSSTVKLAYSEFLGTPVKTSL